MLHVTRTVHGDDALSAGETGMFYEERRTQTQLDRSTYQLSLRKNAVIKYNLAYDDDAKERLIAVKDSSSTERNVRTEEQ